MCIRDSDSTMAGGVYDSCGYRKKSITASILMQGRGVDKEELIIRFVCVTTWFCLSLVLAVAIPNIGQIIKILGSLAILFTFVFPGLCLVRCTFQSDPSLLLRKSWVFVITGFILIGLGAILFGVVFTLAITKLIHDGNKYRL